MTTPQAVLVFGDDEERFRSPVFRVTGNHMRDADGRTVATYKRHQWHTEDGGHYSAYTVARAKVQFFDAEGGPPSEMVGPVRVLRATDGTIYADDKLIARMVEESQLWHHYETDTYWRFLVIYPEDAKELS